MNRWRPVLSFRTAQAYPQQKYCTRFLLSRLISGDTFQPGNGRLYSGWAIGLQKSSDLIKYRNLWGLGSSYGCRSVTTKAERHEDSGLLLHDPKKGDLVYYGPMGGRVRGLKILSVSSSLTCMALLPYVFMRAENLPPFLQATCGLLSGFFIFLQPVIIHWLVYRYVTALYYNQQTKTFTVTRLTFIGTKKDMTFTKADIETVDTPTLFERVRVKNVPLYMENDFFIDIAAFKTIMNYDTDNKRM